MALVVNVREAGSAAHVAALVVVEVVLVEVLEEGTEVDELEIVVDELSDVDIVLVFVEVIKVVGGLDVVVVPTRHCEY